MSSNLGALRQNIDPATLRAAGEAARFAVGVTDAELVTARAVRGGRAKLERYPLASLSELRVYPSPSTTMVEFFFGGKPPRTLAMMYEADAAADFEQILGLLRPLVNGAAVKRPAATAPVQPSAPPPVAVEASGSTSVLRTFGPPILMFLILPALLMYAVKLLVE